jgi:hypothetical protein
MKNTLTILIPLLLFAAACSDDEQPSDSRARAYYELDSLITVESVYVTFKDGSTTWGFQPDDFVKSDTDTLLYYAPQFKTRDGGTLTIEFQLFTPGGQTIAEGIFDLPMSPNWSWNIGFVHAATDPVADCSDCVGSGEFEILIPGHDDEWIFVLWRGRKT